MFNNRYILLLRPSNGIITIASVFVSCLLAGGNARHIPAMLLASFAAGLIGGGGMVINDIFDVEIDRVNKPARPLPSGAVSGQAAAIFYALLTAVGLLLNLFLHPSAQAIALGAAVLIFFYSYMLKRTPLFGNLTVGLLTGLAFIYGGAAVGNIDRAIVPALFAFLINVGRELIKDMEDVEGDALHHAETFPVKYRLEICINCRNGISPRRCRFDDHSIRKPSIRNSLFYHCPRRRRLCHRVWAFLNVERRNT